jgi:hypothetical protein
MYRLLVWAAEKMQVLLEALSYFLRVGSQAEGGMQGRWEPSDAQSELIKPLLRPKRRTDGRGRPWQDTRAVLNRILWGVQCGWVAGKSCSCIYEVPTRTATRPLGLVSLPAAQECSKPAELPPRGAM